MTEAQIIPKHTPDGAAAIRELLQGTADIQGVVAPLPPEEGAVEREGDVAVVERLVNALLQEHIEDGEFSLARALKRAGIPHEMYISVAETRDFMEMYQKRMRAVLLVPRMGAVLGAMTTAGSMGDVRAAKTVLDEMKDADAEDSVEGILRQLNEGGAPAAEAMIHRLMMEAGALMAQMEPIAAQEQVLADAQAMVTSASIPPATRESRLEASDIEAD